MQWSANQKWLPIPDNPNVSNQVVLENAADGRCLDANGLTNNGDWVQLWDYGRVTHPANQIWDWWGGVNQIWQG